MTTPVKIDFVSDISCPWCIIGLRGLEEALARVGGEVEADIRFRPFELNPDMAQGGENLGEHVTRKMGSTREQSAQMRQTITDRAAATGFAINFSDESRVYNTFDAHRLLRWAEEEGGQHALKRALFTAHFTRGEAMDDHATLVAIAEQAGLDGAKAREVLESGRYAGEVRAEEQLWRSRGINSVPAIVLNEKYLVSGGQPAEMFEQALRAVVAEQETA
ncbi:DsbA family oxidoreductase [Sphingobium phenoxybenzoativorans]|uniref:DsbA family oxidoreductase n=1 Tax=Sphingobium phenoxybenzoativorans TaxID=1592790 RepID=A0A975K7X7_9SPHN|nr:DsbA family oxidoreductase [Sphingobium phenoxybenzoativorans]QUT06137.1 DsbA family oxidoreductase [Sphingobium phenoxybenzoativorans]